ncbi:MAG: hypothetical protein ACTSWW_12050, partial [Promethearchaeota archaeon]
MGKSSQEKIAFAKTLIEGGISYREIQNLLQNRFGSGMSNTTLQNLQVQLENAKKNQAQLTQCEKELALYKKLYYELVEAIKSNNETIQINN